MTNQTEAHTPKVGDWLTHRHLVSGAFTQGRITEINGNIATYFNQDAFDGFGAYDTADLTDDICVKVRS